MEKLVHKYDKAVKANKALHNAIFLYSQRYEYATELEQEAYLASLIKHFELFYGTLWKFFKFYLLEIHGIETVGSKDVFKATYDLGLVSSDQFKMLIKAVDTRNETTHVYDEEFAQTVTKHILQIYSAMDHLIKVIDKNNLNKEINL